MGEMADDRLDGTTCELCGRFFCNPQGNSQLYTHGFPAVCWECWKDMGNKQRRHHQQAHVPTVDQIALR